jgi:hypothetical protein
MVAWHRALARLTRHSKTFIHPSCKRIESFWILVFLSDQAGDEDITSMELELFSDCRKAPTCNSCDGFIWIPIWVFYYSMERSRSLL